jgi:ribonuclease HI
MNKFTVSYDMAIDLLRTYVEKLHISERRMRLSGKKLETWAMINDRLADLLLQLKLNGYNIDEILSKVKQDLHLKFSHKQITVRIDGAARGNDNVNIPNQSGIAFIVIADGEVIARHAEYIGSHIELPRMLGEDEQSPLLVVPATNNVAEYLALIKALEFLIDNEITAPDILIMSDSETVVQQVNLTNATRAPHLLRLRNYILNLKRDFEFRLVHVKGEENSEADALVNEAINKALKSLEK